LAQLCQRHLTSQPDAPSERLGRPISPQLEGILLACLEKTRDKRPQTARELSAQLDRATTTEGWTSDDAETWWLRHMRSQIAVGPGIAYAVTTSAVHGASETGPNNADSAAKPDRTSIGGFDQTLAGNERRMRGS